MTTRGTDKPVLSLQNLAGENPEAVDQLEEEPEIGARLKKLHDDWFLAVSLRK